MIFPYIDSPAEVEDLRRTMYLQPVRTEQIVSVDLGHCLLKRPRMVMNIGSVKLTIRRLREKAVSFC